MFNKMHEEKANACLFSPNWSNVIEQQIIPLANSLTYPQFILLGNSFLH